MGGRRNRWALVLAAGSGTRLRSLTGVQGGDPVPKQYCSLAGGPTLLREALSRARRVAPADRVVVVVAEEHAAWWRPALADLPEQNIVVQPINRGTAAGILLPLLTILDRDPDPSVAILPSDHFVAEEDRLAASLLRAMDAAEADDDRLVLLGIEPDAAESEYGWIVPGTSGNRGLRTVRAFVEKPRAEMAARMFARGGVWNSFLMAAGGKALLALFLRRRPSLVGALASAPRATWRDDESRRSLMRIYSGLPVSDFSRELLQGSEDRLALLPVPACGWSDLGTPQRVSACVERWCPPRTDSRSAYSTAPVTLSVSLMTPA